MLVLTSPCLRTRRGATEAHARSTKRSRTRSSRRGRGRPLRRPTLSRPRRAARKTGPVRPHQASLLVEVGLAPHRLRPPVAVVVVDERQEHLAPHVKTTARRARASLRPPESAGRSRARGRRRRRTRKPWRERGACSIVARLGFELEPRRPRVALRVDPEQLLDPLLGGVEFCCDARESETPSSKSRSESSAGRSPRRGPAPSPPRRLMATSNQGPSPAGVAVGAGVAGAGSCAGCRFMEWKESTAASGAQGAVDRRRAVRRARAPARRRRRQSGRRAPRRRPGWPSTRAALHPRPARGSATRPRGFLAPCLRLSLEGAGGDRADLRVGVELRGEGDRGVCPRADGPRARRDGVEDRPAHRRVDLDLVGLAASSPAASGASLAPKPRAAWARMTGPADARSAATSAGTAPSTAAPARGPRAARPARRTGGTRAGATPGGHRARRRRPGRSRGRSASRRLSRPPAAPGARGSCARRGEPRRPSRPPRVRGGSGSAEARLDRSLAQRDQRLEAHDVIRPRRRRQRASSSSRARSCPGRAAHQVRPPGHARVPGLRRHRLDRRRRRGARRTRQRLDGVALQPLGPRPSATRAVTAAGDVCLPSASTAAVRRARFADAAARAAAARVTPSPWTSAASRSPSIAVASSATSASTAAPRCRRPRGGRAPRPP